MKPRLTIAIAQTNVTVGDVAGNTAAPIVRIRSRAFGSGRQLPITATY